MPAYLNLSMVRGTDASLSVDAETSVSGMSLAFEAAHRFGGTPFISKNWTSGFASGISVSNQASGSLTVNIAAGDTSGRDFSNYAYQISDTLSGSVAALVQGWLILKPDVE